MSAANNARLDAMDDASLAAECLTAIRLALGSGERRRADDCWFAARERGREDIWLDAKVQALAERRRGQGL